MNRDPKPQPEGCFFSLLQLFPEYVFGPIFLAYFGLCFWLFDRLPVSSPDAQLALVLAPIFGSGAWVYWRAKRHKEEK